MEDTWDLETVKESEFDQLATFFVPDRPVSENTENRAEASLPRNLVLRPSQILTGVSACFMYFLHLSWNLIHVNSLRLGNTYMHHWTGSSGDGPLPKPMITYCQLDHISNKFQWNFKWKCDDFHSWKCIWKWGLQNSSLSFNMLNKWRLKLSTQQSQIE